MVSEKLMNTIARASTAALLRIARMYHDRGLLHQAISPYLKVVAHYPQSEAAKSAVEGLISIANTMESSGLFHNSMSVYDLMEQAACSEWCDECDDVLVLRRSGCGRR